MKEKEKGTAYYIYQLFQNRKTKATLYCVVVLWLAVITQVFVNKTFYQDLELTDAFISSEAKNCTSVVEVIGEYKGSSLSEDGIKHIIQTTADSVGLIVDNNIVITKEKGRTEYAFSKKADKAETTITMICVDEARANGLIQTANYLLVKIKINESIDCVDVLKERLENNYAKLSFSDVQSTLLFTGSYAGELSLEEKDRIVDAMIQELKGKVAIKNLDNNLFTVYAYTGMVKEYINTSGSRINIQIAISYDEEQDKTYVYMATPLLMDEW